MKTQIENAKQYTPHAGSALRIAITALCAILAKSDIIPQADVEPLAGGILIAVTAVWSIIAKQRALNAQPKGVNYEK